MTERQRSRDPRTEAEAIRRSRRLAAGGPDSGGGSKGDTPGGVPPAGRRSGRSVLFGLGAVLVAAAVGWGALFGLPGGGDSVPEAEAQQISASFQSIVAAGGIPLQIVRADEVDQAIETLPEEIREEVRTEVQNGQAKLAWVSLRDTHAEDGDVVTFKAEGVPGVSVEARNAWKTLAIPYPPSGHVAVTGLHDGGGGITVALKSGAAEVAWPTMREGDTLALPVTPGY